MKTMFLCVSKMVMIMLGWFPAWALKRSYRWQSATFNGVVNGSACLELASSNALCFIALHAFLAGVRRGVFATVIYSLLSFSVGVVEGSSFLALVPLLTDYVTTDFAVGLQAVFLLLALRVEMGRFCLPTTGTLFGSYNRFSHDLAFQEKVGLGQSLAGYLTPVAARVVI